MAEYLIQEDTLTAIADAIRAKTGDTDLLTPEGMATAIAGLETSSQIATGTFTPTYGQLNTGFQITVSGIGFKPSVVFIRYGLYSSSGTSASTSTQTLVALSYVYGSDPPIGYVVAYGGKLTHYFNTTTASCYTLTPYSDGFILAVNPTSNTSWRVFTNVYRYVAIG